MSLTRITNWCEQESLESINCIGTGLARGYLNQPDLTAKSFVPDPFGPGERMYKTGDKVLRDDDGVLTMLDQIDNQVKLRGYRIELGEIDSVLSEQTFVKQSLAVIMGEQDFEKKLVAYVTPETVNTAELEAALKRFLPTYMHGPIAHHTTCDIPTD